MERDGTGWDGFIGNVSIQTGSGRIWKLVPQIRPVAISNLFNCQSACQDTLFNFLFDSFFFKLFLKYYFIIIIYKNIYFIFLKFFNTKKLN